MSLRDVVVSQLHIPAYVESLAASSRDLTVEIEETLPLLSQTQLGELDSCAQEILKSSCVSHTGNVTYALLKITQMKLEKAETKLRQVEPFFKNVRVIVSCHETHYPDEREFSSCTAVIDLPMDLVSEAHLAMLDRLAQMPVILWERYGTDQYAILSYFSDTNQNAADHGVTLDTERLHCLFGRVDADSDPGGYAEDRNLWKKQYDEAVIVSAYLSHLSKTMNTGSKQEDSDRLSCSDNHKELEFAAQSLAYAKIAAGCRVISIATATATAIAQSSY